MRLTTEERTVIRRWFSNSFPPDEVWYAATGPAPETWQAAARALYGARYAPSSPDEEPTIGSVPGEDESRAAFVAHRHWSQRVKRRQTHLVRVGVRYCDRFLSPGAA